MFTIVLSTKRRDVQNIVDCSSDEYWSNVVLMMHMNGADNSTTFIDETGKTVSVVGDTKLKITQSKFGGSSAYFDGTGDYLSVNDARLNLGTGDFTIECWAYFNNKTGYQSLLSKGYIATGDYLVQTSQNTSSFRFYASGTLITTESSEASLNAWHHYAFVRKSGVLYIYRDGSVTGSGACTQDLTNTFAFKLGVGTHLVDGSYYFTGYIDEVRITKGVARYDSNSTKLLMHFDSPFNSGFNDTTGKAITIVNSPVISTARSVFGGSSGYFDGANHLTVANTSDFDFGTGDFTVEAWVNLTRVDSSFAGILEGRPSGSLSDYLFGFRANTPSVIVNGTEYTSTATINANTWYHVAFVRHIGYIKIYVNGNLSGSWYHSASVTPTGLIKIGQLLDSYLYYFFSGYMDELRVSKGVARYTSNFSVPTSPFNTDANTSLLCHFNGDTDVTGKSITIAGNTTISNTQSKFGGYSGYFDGTGDYLTLPASDDWNFGTGDFTIEFWVYQVARSAGGGTAIIDTRPTSTNGFYPYVGIQGTNKFGFYVNGSYTVSSSSTVELNTWYHVAVCKKNSVINLYVNGVLEASAADTNTYSYSNFWIGNNSGNGGTLYALNGYIDELRISKGKALYSGSGDVLLMHMQPAETPATDTTFASLGVAVKNGNLTVSSDNKFGTKSVRFDKPSNSYLKFSPITIGTGDFTIEFWFKTTSAQNDGILHIGPLGGTGANTIAFALSGGTVYYYPGTAASYGFGSLASISLNVWHFVSISKSGSTFTSYIDGVLDITIGVVGSINITNADLHLGLYHTVGYHFDGWIDEFRISNIARSSSVPTQALTSDANTIFFAPFESSSIPISYGNLPLTIEETGKSVTAYGNTTISSTQSKFGGYSGYFDGSGDYLTLPASSDFAFGTGDFTIDCWIMWDGTYAALGRNICSTEGNVGYGQLTIWAPGVSPWGNSGGVSCGGVTSNYYPPANTWVHIAVVRKSGVIYFYGDGVLKYQAAGAGSVGTSASPMYIGQRPDGYHPWFGYIDELRISKGVARYTGNFTPPTAPFTLDAYKTTDDLGNALPPTAPFTYEGSSIGVTNPIPPIAAFPSCLKTWTGTADAYCGNVVLLLNFDGLVSDTQFYDDGINGLTVTKTGNVSYNTSVMKFWDSSAYFDGIGDYLTVSDASLALGAGDFTVECWFYAITSGTLISSHIGTWTSGTWLMTVRVDGSTKLQVFANGFTTLSSTSDISYNQWYHVAFVRQGAMFYLFINGVMEASYNQGTNSLTSNSTLYFGVYTNGTPSYYTGYLSDFRITKGIARYSSNPTKLLMHFDNDMIGVLEETGKTLTKVGSPVITTAKKMVGNSSCYFSSSSYYTVPSSSDWSFGTGDFTIECWVYMAASGNHTLVSNVTHSNENQWAVQISGNNVVITGWFTFFTPSNAASTIAIDTWNHIAFSREGNTLRLFINGNICQTVSNSTNFNVDGALCIGFVPSYYQFTGYLDELRISKGIARYTANFTPSTTPFVADAYTKLLCHFEGAPGVAVEETGKMVTVYGNTTVSNTQSKFGGYSGYFDGSGDYLTLPASDDWNFGAGDFTIEFWIYPTVSSSSDQVLIDLYNSGVTRSCQIYLNNNKINLYVHSGTGLNGISAIAINTWTHVLFSVKSSVCSLYLNGILDASGTISTINYNISIPLRIGMQYDGAWAFTGYIDELRISKGKALYTTNFTPPTQPYTYEGAVTSLSGTLPPTDKLLKCGAGT
jgi:hypothetical protein